MSTPSASRVERILVWDLPVRVMHWLLAASFLGAYLTAESESWRLVHVVLGYTVAALVCFRVFWGFAGSRYARFAQFVKGPSAALAYLRSLLAGRPAHAVGHNPAGALAIVALLALGALTAFSGYATYSDWGGHWLEEVHEVLANTMLMVVLVHVAGVIVGSIAHRENLVRAMFTGRKGGSPDEAIASPRTGWLVALFALLAALWWTQWLDAPPPPPAASHAAKKSVQDDDD
jgi:cytochrome b